MKMKNYITVIDRVLPGRFCNDIIAKFEKNEFHEQVKTEWENRNFTEINITLQSGWDQEHLIFTNTIKNLWREYATQHNILLGSQWPERFGFEQFRMKRYLPNGKDEFSFHTDVGNYGSSRRFLAFLWYLNTVTIGGMTKFAYSPLEEPFAAVPAVQGRVLIFPPLWNYPHWGEKVTSGPKYIVSSYLHYL